MSTHTIVTISTDEPSILSLWGFDTHRCHGSSNSVPPKPGRTFTIEQNIGRKGATFKLRNRYDDVLAQGTITGGHVNTSNGTSTLYGEAKVYTPSKERVLEQRFSFHVRN